jgi:hypothetical protein
MTNRTGYSEVAHQRKAIMPSKRGDLYEYLQSAKDLLLSQSPILARFPKQETERVVGLALLRLAALIRREFKAAQTPVSRVELQELLNEVETHSRHLAYLLSKDELVKALELTPTAESVRDRLHEALQNRQEVVNYLRELADLIPPAQTGLALLGQGGRHQAFHRIQLPPDALLCVYARELFKRLSVTENPPGVGNTKLIDFIEWVWELAVSPPDANKDWSTPIKVAAARRKPGAGGGAHLLARLSATDFVDNNILWHLRAKGAVEISKI